MYLLATTTRGIPLLPLARKISPVEIARTPERLECVPLPPLSEPGGPIIEVQVIAIGRISFADVEVHGGVSIGRRYESTAPHGAKSYRLSSPSTWSPIWIPSRSIQ